MIQFFKDGGIGMWPVLLVGLVLLGSAARFAIDREPVRLRFVAMLSVALMAFSAHAVLLDAAKVMWVVSGEKDTETRVAIFFEGMKESLSPGILGLGLLGVAFVAVAIGVYRTGRRELEAARG